MAGGAAADTDGVAAVRHHTELAVERGDGDGLGTVDGCGFIDTFESIGRQIVELSLYGLQQGYDALAATPLTLDEGVRPSADGLTCLVGRRYLTVLTGHFLIKNLERYLVKS